MKKNNEFRRTGVKTRPDLLHTTTPTQRLMKACKKKKVDWAICSHKYGVWPYSVSHEWYEKNPSKVTKEEFKILVEEFDISLADYKKIFFTIILISTHPDALAPLVICADLKI